MKNFFLIPVLALAWANSLSAAAAPTSPVKVNRTVSKVKAPKTGVEFSANPTTQEISRARVFEEPLVPIGAEPGADENVARGQYQFSDPQTTNNPQRFFLLRTP